MLLTTNWQEVVDGYDVLIQKSNRSSVSLCYAATTPTTEKTFSLSIREPKLFPTSAAGLKLYARATTENASCTLTIVPVIKSDIQSNATLVSTTYTVNTTLPANPLRKYLMVFFSVGSGSIEFGSGGGLIPFNEKEFYEPLVTPRNEIDIVVAGTVIVVEG